MLQNLEGGHPHDAVLLLPCLSHRVGQSGLPTPQASTCGLRCWQTAARATRAPPWRRPWGQGTCMQLRAAGRPTRARCCRTSRQRTELCWGSVCDEVQDSGCRRGPMHARGCRITFRGACRITCRACGCLTCAKLRGLLSGHGDCTFNAQRCSFMPSLGVAWTFWRIPVAELQAL